MKPVFARWDREVIREKDGTVTVCCVADDGRPVAVELDEELAEALGLLLVDPDGS